jgi:hypothetical protein
MAREQPPKHGRPRALWDLDEEEVEALFEEASDDE